MKAATDGTTRTSLDFICDILTTEFDVTSDRALIWEERTILPKDKELFFLVGFNGSPQVVANRNIVVPSADTFIEHQEVNTKELISINICSKNLDALNRKEEALMAIHSLYSQQVQEANSFKIFKNSSIENLSSLEGSSMLKRYKIDIVVFAWYSKTKSADYFDTFSLDLLPEPESEEIEIPLTE